MVLEARLRGDVGPVKAIATCRRDEVVRNDFSVDINE